MIVEVGVSILTLDYEDMPVIDQALMRVSTANSLHLDILNNSLYPFKSFDHKLVKEIQTNLRKVVHLMIKQPEKVVDRYIRAGADTIIFHIEATRAPKKLVEKLKKKKIRIGIAISPETPIKKIEKMVPEIDLVLVMTVKPGKGGQKMLKTQLTKVKSLRKKFPMKDIAVDGGINDKTAHLAIEAGANILVSGSYVFGSPDPKLAIDLLRNA